jgi:hypothetical protein
MKIMLDKDRGANTVATNFQAFKIESLI